MARISLILLGALAGLGASPACAPSDGPPLREISERGMDAASDEDLAETSTPDGPDRVVAWLDAHPTCIGDGTPYFRDETLARRAWHIQNREPSDALYDQMVGGGVAIADLDNDGDLDIYYGVSGGPNRMLLNDGSGYFDRSADPGTLAFADDWTNGVSAVDYDNDGDQDLYLTNRGPDRLLENRGDLDFVDVTAEVGIDAPGNSSTASWGDLDANGHLDLVVATLADFAIGERTGITAPVVYLADGDGGFVAVDTSQFTEGSSYIMPIVDLDADGDVDILHPQEFYTAASAAIIENRTAPGATELDLSVHTRQDHHVAAPATMGAALVDLDANNLPDIFTTNLWGEAYQGEVLARNAGALGFENVAPDYGAQPMTDAFDASRETRAASWAAIAADFRNIGRQDLFVAYGQLAETVGEADPVSYPPLVDKQPDALLLRQPDGRFALAEGSCAESLGDSRGAAVADLDSDGCLDLVVVPREGSARLLMNRCDNANSYVSIDLVGRTSNREAVGSRVLLETPEGVQRRWVTAGSTSVFSSSPRRLHFGLGNSTSITRVTVTWPDGSETVAESIQPNRVHEIVQSAED